MLSSRSHDEMQDIELVRRYKESGDMDVLGVLFGRYMSLVYGVCLKYLKDREESKDAVMQVFEKLAQTLRTHEVTWFKSWLYATARNHCLMQLRAKKGQNVEISETLVMESTLSEHPEDGQEQEENLAKLEKCLERLNQEQQQCVRLFFLQQKSYRQISDATGFDFNQVKSHIQNGKRNLKNCVERNG
ncbi:MAG: sigma-70 family RNA polymerase sigma factor [Bacteroidota bacterium]